MNHNIGFDAKKHKMDRNIWMENCIRRDLTRNSTEFRGCNLKKIMHFVDVFHIFILNIKKHNNRGVFLIKIKLLAKFEVLRYVWKLLKNAPTYIFVKIMCYDSPLTSQTTWTHGYQTFEWQLNIFTDNRSYYHTKNKYQNDVQNDDKLKILRNKTIFCSISLAVQLINGRDWI